VKVAALLPNPEFRLALLTRARDIAFLNDVFDELGDARAQHGGMNSLHEAYSVILEEVEEFWAEVKKKRRERDPRAMYAELVQIAAMALKTAMDCEVKRPYDDGQEPHEYHNGAGPAFAHLPCRECGRPAEDVVHA
jgi:hypothetical protein